MSEGLPTIDSEFSLGVNADAELSESLTNITQGAAEYSTAIDNLITYFNNNELWKGDDATALREAAIKTGGPIDKLKEYKEELNKLSALAEGLRGAIGSAQEGLKKNVNTAMGVGNGGGE